jgi:hypothetical protein
MSEWQRLSIRASDAGIKPQDISEERLRWVGLPLAERLGTIDARRIQPHVAQT